MTTTRRVRPALDVAVGYAADECGRGVVYAAVDPGAANSIVRLSFATAVLPGLDRREVGYAAVAAVAGHLKARGLVRLRLRIADARVAADLAGCGSPPKALAMAYVRSRCILHSLNSARLECSAGADVRDLTARARAEVELTVAA
jgi:hypothetical protein